MTSDLLEIVKGIQISREVNDQKYDDYRDKYAEDILLLHSEKFARGCTECWKDNFEPRKFSQAPRNHHHLPIQAISTGAQFEKRTATQIT